MNEFVDKSPIYSVKDGIQYETARLEDGDTIQVLWKEEFIRREPLNIGVGFEETNDSGNEELRIFIEEILKKGLSIVARDATTNEVVGFRLSDVKRKTDKDHVATDKVWTYLNDLKNFDVFEKYGVEEAMEFVALAVKESHTKRGIAKELINRSLELAKLRNFKVVVTTPTNIITIKMFEKMGFECLREISISDYTIDGVKAFPYATPGQFGRLCALRLL